MSYKKVNFNNYYNNHKCYVETRKKNSLLRKQYLNEVDGWKNKYLSALMSSNGVDVILEVGCATGDLIGRFPIDVPNHKKFGIDISSKNIEFAKQEYPDINFYNSNLENFIKNKGKDIKIDVIILSDILEHVENDVELLRTAGINAKYVLVNIPLEKVWEYRNRCYGLDDEEGHLRAYDISDVREMINTAQLKEHKYIVRKYIKEQVFKEYLKDKFLGGTKKEMMITKTIKYLYNLLHTKVMSYQYKSNYFALLSKNISYDI